MKIVKRCPAHKNWGPFCHVFSVCKSEYHQLELCGWQHHYGISDQNLWRAQTTNGAICSNTTHTRLIQFLAPTLLTSSFTCSFLFLFPNRTRVSDGSWMVVLSDPDLIEKTYRRVGKYPRRPSIPAWIEYKHKKNMSLGLLTR